MRHPIRDYVIAYLAILAISLGPILLILLICLVMAHG